MQSIRPKRLARLSLDDIADLCKRARLPFFGPVDGKTVVFLMPASETLFIYYAPFGEKGPIKYRRIFLPAEFRRDF